MPQYIRCRSCDERIAVTSQIEQAGEGDCPSCGAYVSLRRGGSRRQGSGSGLKIVIGLLVVAGLLGACCIGVTAVGWSWLTKPTSFPEQTEDYAQARQKFQTSLTQFVPAPQP